MNNKILLLSGDPYSINSELIFKTWKKLNKRTRFNITREQNRTQGFDP